MYLNVAQTGPGVFGVEAAAKYYFNKNAKELSRKEAAMIASCLPNPVLFTIHPMSHRVAYRYPWIMRQMNNLEADPDIQALLTSKSKAANSKQTKNGYFDFPVFFKIIKGGASFQSTVCFIMLGPIEKFPRIRSVFPSPSISPASIVSQRPTSVPFNE